MDGEGQYVIKARYMIFFWSDVEIFSSGDIMYLDNYWGGDNIKRFDTLVDALKAIQDYQDLRDEWKRKNMYIPIDNIESIEHAECIDELSKE